MHLNQEPIKYFLDKVDTVLNSNTFLLKTKIAFENVLETERNLHDFISSGKFKKQILKQDIIREWTNYHQVNDDGKLVITATGILAKPTFKIQLKRLTKAASLTYFRSMLTVETDTNNYNFWSPYSKAINSTEAMLYVQNFLGKLGEGQEFIVYTCNTDFCYSIGEQYHNEKVMGYFEGDYGSDSMTVIIRKDNEAFILLTNGRD